MNGQPNSHDLREIARQAMIERGLEPEFPPDALRQAEAAIEPRADPQGPVRDLRGLLWCSIDNESSKDLDQLTVAEPLGGGEVRVLVAIADVDALVKAGSPIDRHAAVNTTSVYTAARIFSMLPERLSTDLTSLAENEDRPAVVMDMSVGVDGVVGESDVYPALVRNRAKLDYRGVAAWLEGRGGMPARVAEVPGLDGRLRLQDQAAQAMRAVRHLNGALEFETIEPEAVVRDGRISELRLEGKNRAKELIEDFMIAANTASADFLARRGRASLRRVVRSPERWDRIRQVARGFSEELPTEPDPRALAAFLSRRRRADPLRFPDLSLTVVKLMGPGEYVVQGPGAPAVGHFGLAVRDYGHSTAPNRRFADLLTQRMLKAALAGGPAPYPVAELALLAARCTDREDAARKVERQVRKSAAALLLSDRIGQMFDAIVTGANAKGTWVRVPNPPVEGKLVAGQAGADVGDRLRVRLAGVDVPRGFIDFTRDSGGGPSGPGRG